MIHLRNYIVVLLFVPLALQAKTVGDSLTLSGVLSIVISNYPSLKKVDKELTAADAKIGLTKTAYLPDVNFATSYTRIGPVTTIPFGGQSLQLYPPDVYSAVVSVNENIYDFGKTDKSVELDQKNKEMIQLSTHQIKQRLSAAAMSNFYSISFLQQAITIKVDQLKNLNEHLHFVQKRADTGSATKYDILTTKVRISSIENQKTDIQTALQIQISLLNSLMGKSPDSPIILKSDIVHAPRVMASADSLCTVAYFNRPELKLALQKEEISKSRMNVIKVQNNPSLNAFASGGLKNGYLNDQFKDVGKLNFAVGVGLKVPLFDANRSKYLKIQANADLEGNQQETELARRNITTEVIESRANAEASLKKVKQSELQVEQASQAFELADVNYKAGVVTNLDLLDSYTSLSESKLSLFRTKIDYTVSLQRLKIALGEQIY